MHWTIPIILFLSCSQASAIFSVCSFNVWGLYISRHREVRIQALARQLLNSTRDDFDLVGLQELWMSSDYQYLRRELAEKYPHSAYFYSGAIGSGLATFSKFPIESVQFTRYSIGGRPEHIFKGDWFAAKGVAITKVIHPSGAKIALLNTHMAASYNRTVGGYDCYETHRLIHAYEFARTFHQQAKLADHVIGLGDFNLQPSSSAYQAFLADEAGWFSPDGVQPQVRSAFGGQGEPSSFNSPKNTYRRPGEPSQSIDHIFHSTGLSPSHARMVFTERVPHYEISLSDHFGIAADFKISTETPIDGEEKLAAMEYNRMNLANHITSRMESQIKTLKSERQSSYAFSAFLMFLSIGLLTWSLILAFHDGRPHFSVKIFLLASNAVLVFILGFWELFRGFAFIGEELAGHLQFLEEFTHSLTFDQ